MTRIIEPRYSENAIPVMKKDPLHVTVRQFVKKEWNMFFDNVKDAYHDSFSLVKHLFLPKMVDKTIKAHAFECIPENPNGIAILASHGFGATPEIYRELAPLLARQGYYVRAIRLSGHATNPAHLAHTSGVDWFSSVAWHYKDIAKDYDRIFVIGHSLGGTLGLLLATIYPVETVIALCTPVNLHIKPAKFVREVSSIIKYWPRSRNEKKLIRREKLATYEQAPLYAIAGIFEVGNILRARADKLTQPVLYVRGMLDHKNLVDQPDEFRKFFPNTPTEFKDASNSHHYVFFDKDKELIFQWIIDWLDSHK